MQRQGAHKPTPATVPITEVCPTYLTWFDLNLVWEPTSVLCIYLSINAGLAACTFYLSDRHRKAGLLATPQGQGFAEKTHKHSPESPGLPRLPGVLVSPSFPTFSQHQTLTEHLLCAVTVEKQMSETLASPSLGNLGINKEFFIRVPPEVIRPKCVLLYLSFFFFFSKG